MDETGGTLSEKDLDACIKNATPKPPRQEEVVIEPIATSTEQEPTEHHRRVAKLYNTWLGESGLQNGIAGVYEIESFQDNWPEIGAEEYHLHELSILGLKPESQNREVSALQVKQALDRRREENQADERVASLREAIAAFNSHCGQYGIETSAYDPGRVYLLPAQRIREIHAQKYTHHVAATLVTKTRDILIPTDNENYMEPDDYFHAMTHEAGHEARMRKEIDTADTEGSILLEEGLVQLNALIVEKEVGRSSETGRSAYGFETWVARNLTKNLGVESLIGHSHQKIRVLVNKRYAYLNGDREPYDMLCDDMVKAADVWASAEAELAQLGENATDEDVDRIFLRIGKEKGQQGRFIEKWRFNNQKGAA